MTREDDGRILAEKVGVGLAQLTVKRTMPITFWAYLVFSINTLSINQWITTLKIFFLCVLGSK